MATFAFVAGGLLLVWSSYLHYHLWHDMGYRIIPTIGTLFLLQSIAGAALGLLAIARRRVWTGVLGAGFAASTMAGFLISVNYGLFGFKDYWTVPYAHEAFIVELSALVFFVLGVVICASRPTRA